MAEVTEAIGQRFGRYHVVEKLGGGGMGTVFRARDEQLERDVAIKLLPPGHRSYLESRLRFEQEARMVGALDHPNILAVHDIGEHDGTAYLVMELLEGKTLAELIRERKGGLGWRRAVEYSAQVARGLAAIHEGGIVHRDLKPHNLFVTRDSYVKILDFGLAKVPARDVREEGAVDLTPKPGSGRTGVMIGTVAYMSPEQVAGKELDHRSDIFTFGVVLYEMLHGRNPFRGSNASECLVAILDKDPPSLTTLDPEIPESLERLVRRCLAKRPEDRYQSAHELAHDLQALLTGSPPVLTGGYTRLKVPVVSRRTIGLAATFILTIAAVAVITWLLAPGGSAREPFLTAPGMEQRRVAVFPFENLTGEPGLDGISVSAATMIADSLVGSGAIDVVLVDRDDKGSKQRRSSGGAPFHRESLLSAARSADAATLVTGACSWVGLKLQLEAWVIDVQKGTLIRATTPVGASAESPDKALEMLCKQMSSLVVWHLSDSVYLLANPVPPRWEAYQDLAAALGLDGGSALPPAEQIPRLDRALQLDPDLLGARLAKVSALLDDDLRCAEAAVLLDRLHDAGSRLTPFGREIVAFREAHMQGNWAQGLRHCRSAQELEPRADLRYHIALFACRANRPGEALAALTTAPLVPGADGPMHYASVLTQALHMLGRYEEELQEARLARELFSDLLWPRSREIRALVALGRVSEAEQLSEACMAAPSRQPWDPAEVLWHAACELREHGHHEAGLRIGEHAVSWLRSLPAEHAGAWGFRWALAGSLCQAEHWQEAEALYRGMAEEAGQVQSVLCREDQRLVWLHGTLGALAARRGDHDAVLEISARLEEVGGCPMGSNTYARARVAAQLGQREQALDLLRQAFAQGMEYGPDISSDPDLQPLRHDPRLAELLRPTG